MKIKVLDFEVHTELFKVGIVSYHNLGDAESANYDAPYKIGNFLLGNRS